MVTIVCVRCRQPLEHDGAAGTFACPFCSQQFTIAAPAPAGQLAPSLPNQELVDAADFSYLDRRHFARPAPREPSSSRFIIGISLGTIAALAIAALAVYEGLIWRTKSHVQDAVQEMDEAMRGAMGEPVTPEQKRQAAEAIAMAKEVLVRDNGLDLADDAQARRQADEWIVSGRAAASGGGPLVKVSIRLARAKFGGKVRWQILSRSID